MKLMEKIKKYLFYGGIEKEEFLQTKELVAGSNLRSLTQWSILVTLFWLYCMAMSLTAEDYRICRPAYTVALSMCIVTYFCCKYLIPKHPKVLPLVMGFFRLSLLGGGIGIAVCQWDVRSLTMFAVAIIIPSIFIDSTLSSLIIDLLAIIIYILMGRNVIAPDIFSWGLGNLILFSVFGLLIGNAINKERYERYVLADSAKKLAEMQTRYAYFDQMTGLKNRRAYVDKLQWFQEEKPETCCVVMIDINGLKHMNDTFGHDAGDELIIGTSECLSRVFPPPDEIYRLGGDEFCVLTVQSEDAVQERLSALEKAAGEWKGRFSQGLSLACGIASGNADDLEKAAKVADARMYEAKRRHYAGRS